MQVFTLWREGTIGGMVVPLTYLLVASGLTTTVLVILVIYGHTLSNREDDQLFVNKSELTMMGSEQLVLIGKMERLKKVIIGLAVAAGILMLASIGTWAWIGRTR